MRKYTVEQASNGSDRVVEVEAEGYDVLNNGTLIFYKEDDVTAAAFSPGQWTYFVGEDLDL